MNDKHSVVFNHKMQHPSFVLAPIPSDRLAFAVWEGGMPDKAMNSCLPKGLHHRRERESSRNEEFKVQSFLLEL